MFRSFPQINLNTTWYADGFSIGRWSVRLSNVSLNVSRMTAMLMTGVVFFLPKEVSATIAKGLGYHIIQFTAQGTDYQIRTKSLENILPLVSGLEQCGISKTSLALSSENEFSNEGYQIIPSFIFKRSPHISLFSELSPFPFNGVQYPLKEIEACALSLVEKTTAEYLRELMRANKISTISKALQFPAFVCAVILIGYYLYRQANGANALQQANNPPPQAQTPLQSNSVFKPSPIRFTFAERLEKIGVDIDDYPEAAHFKCPISLSIMERPMIADDGNSYDKDSIEEWMKTHNFCPKNPSVRLTKLIPNISLRAQAIEFVEKQERLAKKKSKKQQQVSLYQEDRKFLSHSH